MDWNWFFSSSAQSAAAIVGIFAAFIITKIVNNQGEFSNKKRQIKKFTSNSMRLEDEANARYFDWYSERTLENEFESLERRLKEDDEILSPEQYYFELNFPEFVEKEKVLSGIQQKIDIHQTPSSRDSLNFPFHITTPPINIPTNLSISQQLSEERDLIYKLINDTNHHIRDLRDFLAAIKNNPESSGLITFSIISVSVLFFVGVIYPLSFLPLEQGVEISISLSVFWDILFSLKGAWLFAVSLIFNIILLVFLVINIKMKHSKSEIETLERYSKIQNYSSHFEIMQNNLAHND